MLAATVLLAGSAVCTVSVAWAQAPALAREIQQTETVVAHSEPKAQFAAIPPAQPEAATRQSPQRTGPPGPAQPNEHPLVPILQWAARELPAVENLKDYSATFVKRERVNGRLTGYEYLAIKVRHKPFSVYANFLAPATVHGQEVIYVEGRNGDNMWAHSARSSMTVLLRPDGPMAMQGQRYPLTEIGLLNLIRRLVDVGQQDVHHGECEVKYFKGAKLNGRTCTVLQVQHPVRREMFRFHAVRLFIDDDLKLPIRYELYEWPHQGDGPPELTEEYTYLDLKLNNGFTDEDFGTKNPKYRFQSASAE